MTRSAATLLLLLAAPAHVGCTSGAAGQISQEQPFAALVADLSEPAGYFDTDNLISNEASYLHVMGKLRELGVRGGAYLGVGPDQNFSYMAQIRPSIAFMIDIRRDNVLQHLIFKALFEIAPTRIEYLALLFGRPPPDDAASWDQVDVAELVAYIDRSPVDPVVVDRARARVDSATRSFGVPLTAADLATIDRFHRAFISEGMSLQFRSTGRAPRFYYPTYRDLLLERDLSGRRMSYLASEEGYRFLKLLQEKDLVIPVVGDLAGDHAVRAIAELLERRGERVSAYYTSNVEFYLFRAGTFPQFAENVLRLPRDARSVIIRSVFHSMFGPHPLAVRGYYSTQLLQTIESLARDNAAGGYRSYWDVVTRHALR